jgi:hypothetical protein
MEISWSAAVPEGGGLIAGSSFSLYKRFSYGFLGGALASPMVGFVKREPQVLGMGG